MTIFVFNRQSITIFETMGFRFCFHLPTLASLGRRDEGRSCWWSGRRRRTVAGRRCWRETSPVLATQWRKNRALEGGEAAGVVANTGREMAGCALARDGDDNSDGGGGGRSLVAGGSGRERESGRQRQRRRTNGVGTQRQRSGRTGEWPGFRS